MYEKNNNVRDFSEDESETGYICKIFKIYSG